MKLLLIAGLAALVWWLPQNAQHEGAHALVAKAYGGKIVRFWPFPGRRLGYFTWAHVLLAWDVPPGRPFGTAGGHLSAAPLWANLIMLSLISLALAFSALPPALAAVLVGLALTNFVDGAVHLSTFMRREPKMAADGWKWAAEYGVTLGFCRALTILWWLGWPLVLGVLLLI